MWIRYDVQRLTKDRERHDGLADSIHSILSRSEDPTILAEGEAIKLVRLYPPRSNSTTECTQTSKILKL